MGLDVDVDADAGWVVVAGVDVEGVVAGLGATDEGLVDVVFSLALGPLSVVPAFSIDV